MEKKETMFFEARCTFCGRKIFYCKENFIELEEKYVSEFNKSVTSDFMAENIDDYGFTKEQKEKILEDCFKTKAKAEFLMLQYRKNMARKMGIPLEKLHFSGTTVCVLAE